MNQNSSTSFRTRGISSLVGILIILIIATIIGGVIYYQYSQSNKEIVLPTTKQNQLPVSIAVNWADLMPEIQEILKEKNMAGDYPTDIYMNADITGDGVDEALVETGQCGVSICFVALFQLENNKPVLARFKMKDGMINTPSFGSGASAGYGNSINFFPEKQTIYTLGYTHNYNNGLSPKWDTEWDFAAYQWAPQDKLFTYNKELSEEVKNLPEVQKIIKDMTLE